MRNLISRFLAEEHGAVSVEWLVLVAAIVGFALVVVGTIQAGAIDVASDISSSVAAYEVGER